MKFLSDCIQQNGVWLLSPHDKAFEQDYLRVRQVENRVYSDEIVKQLPFVPDQHPQFKEWMIRSRTLDRMIRYFQSIKKPVQILDLGCGNGWFTNHISSLPQTHMLGMDINLPELEQAARLFGKDTCQFAFGDVFNVDLKGYQFDQILLNSVVQYFPNLPELIRRLLELLTENGCIHLIDSPFYPKSKIKDAKLRTQEYYTSLGVSAMKDRYFHHSYDDLKEFNFRIRYNPNSLSNRLKKLTTAYPVPFPCVSISH